MKKLIAFLIVTVLSITAAMGAIQFYDERAKDWQIIGVVGSNNLGELKNTTCYMLLEKATTKLLVGYDLANDELFLLVKDSTWKLDPSADPPNSLGYIEFVGTDIIGEVEMNVVASDRIAIRRVDVSGFLPTFVNSTKIIFYNNFVPKTVVELTDVESAVILMNTCVGQGRELAASIQA